MPKDMGSAWRRGAWGSATLVVMLAASCGVHRDALGIDDDPASAEGGRPGARGDVTRLDPLGPDAGPGGGPGAGNPGGGDKSVPTSCGSYRIPVTDQTPEVLVVLDRSGSMRQLGVDRWAPSVAAVDNLVHSLASSVHFGLLTFPGDCSSLANADEQVACTARLLAESSGWSCEPGRVTVPVASGNVDTISTMLQNASPDGATPTASAIDAAAQALLALPVAASTGSRSILLVTDGAPNCALGLGGLIGVGIGPSSVQPEAVTQTVDAITRAAASGVQTHVIGYDSQSDPYLSDTLDQMARAGGTGDSKHRPVEDQASLINALSGLTRRALMCELRLDVPTDPSLIRVNIDGSVIPRDDVNGWTLAANGQSLSLRGSACDGIAGGMHQVGLVDVLCPPPAVRPDAGVPGGDLPGNDVPVDSGVPFEPPPVI